MGGKTGRFCSKEDAARDWQPSIEITSAGRTGGNGQSCRTQVPGKGCHDGLEVRHGYRRDRTGMIKVSRMMPGARPKGIGLQGKDCLRKYLHGYRRSLPRMVGGKDVAVRSARWMRATSGKEPGQRPTSSWTDGAWS